MKPLLTIALLTVLTTPVLAETRIALGGWSHHYAWADNITNETHNIVGIERDGWSAGYFENSYGRDTFFVAHNWRYPVTKHVSITLSAGLNKGYRECYGDSGSGGKVCPHGFVGLSYEKYPVVPSIKLLPGAVVFSPEIKF